jgi:hypothetical protein
VAALICKIIFYLLLDKRTWPVIRDVYSSDLDHASIKRNRRNRYRSLHFYMADTIASIYRYTNVSLEETVLDKIGEYVFLSNEGEILSLERVLKSKYRDISFSTILSKQTKTHTDPKIGQKRKRRNLSKEKENKKDKEIEKEKKNEDEDDEEEEEEDEEEDVEKEKKNEDEDDEEEDEEEDVPSSLPTSKAKAAGIFSSPDRQNRKDSKMITPEKPPSNISSNQIYNVLNEKVEISIPHYFVPELHKVYTLEINEYDLNDYFEKNKEAYGHAILSEADFPPNNDGSIGAELVLRNGLNSMFCLYEALRPFYSEGKLNEKESSNAIKEFIESPFSPVGFRLKITMETSVADAYYQTVPATGLCSHLCLYTAHDLLVDKNKNKIDLEMLSNKKLKDKQRLDSKDKVKPFLTFLDQYKQKLDDMHRNTSIINGRLVQDEANKLESLINHIKSSSLKTKKEISCNDTLYMATDIFQYAENPFCNNILFITHDRNEDKHIFVSQGCNLFPALDNPMTGILSLEELRILAGTDFLNIGNYLTHSFYLPVPSCDEFKAKTDEWLELAIEYFMQFAPVYFEKHNSKPNNSALSTASLRWFAEMYHKKLHGKVDQSISSMLMLLLGCPPSALQGIIN